MYIGGQLLRMRWPARPPTEEKQHASLAEHLDPARAHA